MSSTVDRAAAAATKRTWVKPEAVPLSSHGPTRKLNVEPAERSRSGISYAPS